MKNRQNPGAFVGLFSISLMHSDFIELFLRLPMGDNIINKDDINLLVEEYANMHILGRRCSNSSYNYKLKINNASLYNKFINYRYDLKFTMKIKGN